MTSFLIDFSNELADVVERAGASVIAVEEGGREGVSGTIWRDEIAVTADHTIRGRDTVTVRLPSGERMTAPVLGRDSGTDLALLKISGVRGQVDPADEAQSRAGEIVLSIARKADSPAAAYGIISAVGGEWHTWSGARIDRWFRLDLTPFPGFSGGPVVTARGEALGMATSGSRGSAVVIPASTVNRVLDQVLAKGRVARGYLGAGLQPVAFPEASTDALGLKAEHGLLVILLEPNGPAAKAGVVIGDMLLRIAGKELRSLRNLHSALDGERIGKPVGVDLLRGGKLLHLEVTVGEKPER